MCKPFLVGNIFSASFDLTVVSICVRDKKKIAILDATFLTEFFPQVWTLQVMEE